MNTRRLAVFIAIGLCWFSVPIGSAERSFHTRELMSTETFKNAGLTKLTPGELANLDAWVTTYTSTVMDFVKGQQVGASSGLAPQPSTPKQSTCVRHSHQGCCSRHGGVSTYDPGTCRIICGDGTYSPTCSW
jgi:hypothetical protein